MSYTVHDVKTLKDKRRSETFDVEIPYRVGGEMHIVRKHMVKGEMDMPVLGDKPLGELMHTTPALESLAEKVVLDVELGREEVPVLYTPIYQRLEDPNFPRVLDAKWALEGRIVFLERMENEEVKFGTLAAEQGPIARIVSYAAGFEYTEEMLLYPYTFELEVMNRAMGEAYNALLNEIHLAPILDFDYQAANQTAAQGDDDEAYALQIRKTLRQALVDTATAGRPGSILLANAAQRWDIEDSLKGMWVSGTQVEPLEGITDIIYYNGWSVTVGEKTYSYSGVPLNTAYLIRPRRGFKELVKRDLMVDAQPGPLNRLVEEQVVGRAYRGVFAAIEENVQEVDLTEQTS